MTKSNDIWVTREEWDTLKRILEGGLTIEFNSKGSPPEAIISRMNTYFRDGKEYMDVIERMEL